MKRHLIIYSLLFFLFCVLSCRNKQAVATEESSAHDLEQIKDSGELVVLTLYSSTSYFISVSYTHLTLPTILRV